jgi:glycosyltransferase involved in cell wall biosynthesis
MVYRFHIVHAHSTFPTGLTAVIMQRLFGIPAIVSLDGGEGVAFPDLEFGDLHSRRRTKINQWVLNRARVVTTLTNFHRTLIEENLSWDRKILVIPRGVDTDHFVLKKDTSLHDPLRIVSVGYLSIVKDPITLLKTFQLILKTRPASLTIVGRDYMKGEIQKLAISRGVNSFVDFVSQVLLHTSRYESQGMVVAEAMACGVLVCGTNVGLIDDLANRCCMSSPVGDAEQLANKVLQLIGDPGLMSTLRTNAMRWSADFSLTKTVSRWSEIYDGLTETQK